MLRKMSLQRSLSSFSKFLRPLSQKYAQSLYNTPVLQSGGVQHIRLYRMHAMVENKYAYQLLESKGHIAPIHLHQEPLELTEELTTFLRQNWTKKSPQELFESFGIIAKYCSCNKICISNKIFDDFIDVFTDNMKHLTDEELKTVFLYLKMVPETPSVRTRNFIEVWAALDDACLARLRDWPTDTKLEFARLTFELSIARSCDYTHKCLRRLCARTSTMTVSQVLQTSFLLNVTRDTPLDKHNMELYLEEHFSEFTIDDLSIMAMGFFKTKSPIRSLKLLNMIVDRVISEKEELDDISFAALMKLVRYSANMLNVEKILQLLSELESEIPRLSIQACIHLNLISSTAYIMHKSSLQQIIERASTEITSTRMKDIERLLLNLAVLNFINRDFIQLALDELRKPERQPEIEKYPRVFLSCIYYVTTLDHFPLDMIAQILDPKFIKHAFGEPLVSLPRDLLCIDNTVQINCPEYTGPRLSEKANRYLAKKFTNYVPTEDFPGPYNTAEKFVLEMILLLRKISGGKTYVCGDHALPHFQRGDIFLCQDVRGNPVDISAHFPIKPFGPIKPAPPTGDKWIAIIAGAKNAYIKNLGILSGSYVTRCRDLRKLGYHPVVISWFDWSQLDSEEEKIAHLQKEIKDAM